MERKNHRHVAPVKYTGICIFLIVLFHCVGLAGFLIPRYTDLFLKLVPYHLLLMLALIVYSHPDKNKTFWTYLIASLLAGFIVEMMGVQTGMIFGQYKYGKTLGFKIADTPLIIGVNWALLVYCTGVFVKQFHISNHIYRALIGALILLCFDILLEPVAVKYDYWSWRDMSVPFRNYIGWFVVSYLLLQFFYMMDFKKHNLAAIALLFTQIAFFIALNLWAF